MPRYDYRCVECSNEFELVQTFAQAGTGTCPVCSGRGQRLFHAVPVIYKGSGFYTTDYGRPKRPAENGAKDSSDSKDGAASSSDKSSDSKSGSSAKATADAGSSSS